MLIQLILLIQIMQEKMTYALIEGLRRLGCLFGGRGGFNPLLLKEINGW
jgi:hypothetical protein